MAAAEKRAERPAFLPQVEVESELREAAQLAAQRPRHLPEAPPVEEAAEVLRRPAFLPAKSSESGLVPPRPPTGPRINIRGEWLLHRCEGDGEATGAGDPCEGLLIPGVAGGSRHVVIVDQEGDSIVVTAVTQGAGKPHAVTSLSVGTGWQPVPAAGWHTGLSGSAYWGEGGVVMLWKVPGRDMLATTRRSLTAAGELAVECRLTLPAGSVARGVRVYRRLNPRPSRVPGGHQASEEDRGWRRPLTIEVLFGRWKQTRHDGDIIALLGEMGVGWLQQKFLQSVSYGNGLFAIEIGPDLDSCAGGRRRFAMRQQNGPRSCDVQFSLDAAPAEVALADGTTALSTFSWRGDALYVASQRLCGKVLPEVRRYVNPDGELVTEAKLADGQCVRRFYKRY